MSTQRRAHVRHSRTTPPHARLHGNSDTVTLVATWRGQLLICTVVLAIGAVYFVVREPIRQWRQRQRERQSRAVSEELLAADQARGDPDRGGASHGTSSALAKGQTARERGREKRKEKKRLTTTAGLTSSSGTSAVTSPGPSSPSLPSEATNEASGPFQTQPATVSPVIDLQLSSVQEGEPSSLLLSPQVVDLDSASEAGDMSPDPTNPTHSIHSRATSTSVAHDEPLSASSTGRKKKRKSKARTNGHAADLKVTLPRNLNLSSDDVASHASGTSSTPNSPRRRRKTSIAGMPMSPALELLIDNHERTIDSLRAEIGQCKAEEGKARDDEARAREELRRSRATEDRMRAEAERARKARDRADADMRRMEAEIMLLRNRFDTLQHMYQGVCHRLRDYDHPETRNSPRPPLSPAIGTPMVGYPSPMPSPMSAFGQYNHPGHVSMYSSPIQSHGFPPNFVLAPLPHRRGEGSGGGSSEHLAGPLTPGHATSSTPSQASSPYPSDLSLHPSSATPASSATGVSDLSAAELRRLNIASSVLKKKTRVTTATSESGESHRVSEPADVSEDIAVEGLGIKQLETMPSSAFPSVNGTHSSPASPTSAKQASTSPRVPTKKASTDSISSDASSGARGQQLLITPSDTGPKHDLKDAVAVTVDTDATTTPSAGGADDCAKHFSLNDDDHDDGGGGVPNVDAACAEYVPMYASLAHTPEQLAEIARLRETALRDRERRTRV